MTITYRYPAVCILQSGQAQPLVLLAAKATEINRWAGVPQKLRVIVDENVNTELLGFQRDEDPERIEQIAKFYADANNVLQNPLLCAIRKPTGQEVTFIAEEGGSPTSDIVRGQLEITVVDRSKQSLATLFNETRLFLEERVPALVGLQPSEHLLTKLRSLLNSTEDAETTDQDDVDPAPLEEALTEQSHIAEFWDAIAAREQLLSELGKQFDGDEFLGFSKHMLVSYLCPIILVDGQHRLLGALKAADTALQQDGNRINRAAELLAAAPQPQPDVDQIQFDLLTEKARTLPISLLLDERPEEHVFQFVVVNQKATPVRAALLGTIISTSLAEDELSSISERLESAGVPLQSSVAITYFAKNENSPFAGLVSRGMLGDGTDKLPWSVLGQIVLMFRNLRGAKYFHDPKIDYADIWQRRLLENSDICADWNLHDAPSAFDYWKQSDGPWRDVFVNFWTAVRDTLGETSNKAAPNYWGQPRSSNLFNKPSLLILATDFFAYLVESRQIITSADSVKGLVADWLRDVNTNYFARDWKLSGVKKDSIGIRKQWSYQWFSHRRDPKSLPPVPFYSRLYKNP